MSNLEQQTAEEQCTNVMSNLEHCQTELQEIAKYNVKSYKATWAEHQDNARHRQMLWNVNSNF